MHMDQLEDITPFANQDVMIGGIVTDLRIGQTKTGKPYGIVKMEDYSGAGELALFGDDWANFSGYFQIGNSLFVTARVEERQWKQNTYELKIGRVEFLTDVKDQKIKSITITLQTNLLNRKTANELSSLIKQNEGPTDIFFNVIDGKKQSQVMLQCNDYRVSVGSELINYLNDNSIEYQIN